MNATFGNAIIGALARLLRPLGLGPLAGADPELEEARRWPRPEDFDRMSPEEFHAYVERIGFDARIKAALAEPTVTAAHPGQDPDLAP